MNRPRPPADGWWLRVTIIAVALAGCAADPPMPEGQIRTVDPGRPATEPGLILPDTDPVRWVSRRLSLPLTQPVEDAWLLADESVLNELSRAVWNGNGLRVGVMPASRGPAFSESLGNDIDHRDTQILSYGFPEEIRESPTLRAEFFADLTLPPRPVTMEFFTRGRLRMLMASRPLGNGTTRVTLTPQHYLRRTTLLPRSPQERKLDGRVFNELAVEVTVGPRDILLLGFYQSPPVVTQENDGDEVPGEIEPSDQNEGSAVLPDRLDIDENSEPSSDGDTSDEATVFDEAAEEPLPPLNLGRGLFTTGIADDDSQFLFLLRPLP